MAGVLDGLEVLDLSTGLSGPVTTMLLADHGGRVTKIEPPGGEWSRVLSGSRVWNRGKRSAFLDLTDDADRARFHQPHDMFCHPDKLIRIGVMRIGHGMV